MPKETQEKLLAQIFIRSSNQRGINITEKQAKSLADAAINTGLIKVELPFKSVGFN